jgi:PAS domain-containing protein
VSGGVQPGEGQEKRSAAERVFHNLLQSLGRIPWTSRFAGLLAGSLLLVMLAPGGGILSLLTKAESTMERMSASHALEIARVSARINEPLIVTPDAFALDRANVSALDMVPGVSPGGAKIVDIRGTIKLPKDQVGTQIEGISSLINAAMGSRKTEYTQSGGKLRILAPIRYESEISGPAQVVGGLYVEYEISEFINDTGRPSSLALVAFVVIGLIIVAIFMVTWRMTNLPLRHVQEETELAMKGSLPEVTSVSHWPEMEALVHSINRVLRRADSGGVNFDGQLATLVEMSPWPIILTDGQLRVTHSNPVSSKILTASPEACIGQALPRLIRDPAIANTMKALVAKVGGGQGNQGSDSIVIDGRNRTLSIRVETSAATGAVEYAVVLIT